MRSPSEDLFRLIKAMSKSEKRNFTLQAKTVSGDKKYIELFSLIDRQDQYDEAKVIKSLSRGAYGGQFSVTKNYLYRLLLKNLTYQQPGAGSELLQWRDQIRFLLARELFGGAGKMLRKAIREAEKQEDFLVLYELLQFQSEMVIQTRAYSGPQESLEEIRELRCKTLEQLNNLDDFVHLHQQVTQLRQTRNLARREADQDKLAQIARHPLLSGPEKALSVRAQLEYLAIQRKLHSYGARMDKAVAFSRELIAVFEANPLLREKYLDRYLQELSNLCTYCFRGGAYQETNQILEQFTNLQSKFPHSRAEIFQSYYILSLAFSVHVGTPENSMHMVPDIERELDSVGERMPLNHSLWLHYLLAYMHLMAGMPREAERWITRFFNLPRTEFRVDLQGFGRMLNLLIQFENENFLGLEQEIQKVHRFLDKNQSLHDYENALLKTLRFLVRRAGTPELNDSWEVAKERFWAALASQEAPSPVHDMLDFELWLDSHGKGISLAELRRQKVRFPVAEGA